MTLLGAAGDGLSGICPLGALKMLAVGLVKWSQGRPMSGLGVLSRPGGFEDSRRV